MKAQAMGQLIIFIAAVLVVAVAAGVLLTTTDSLQQRALGTGRAVSAEIGTGMQLLEIFVEDGSTTLENISITIRPTAGSNPIPLETMLLELSFNNISIEKMYEAGLNCNTINETTGFAVEYIRQSPNNVPGIIRPDELVKICATSSRTMKQGEHFDVILMPRSGSPLFANVRIPNNVASSRISLFP